MEEVIRGTIHKRETNNDWEWGVILTSGGFYPCGDLLEYIDREVVKKEGRQSDEGDEIILYISRKSKVYQEYRNSGSEMSYVEWLEL